MVYLKAKSAEHVFGAILVAAWGHLVLEGGAFGLVEALRGGGTLGAQGGPKEESREARASLERVWVPPTGSIFYPGAPTGAPKSPKRLKAPSLITMICVYDNLSFPEIICRF